MKASGVYFGFFRNGSSADMAVDGTTPVSFDLEAPAGDLDKTYIKRVNVLIIDGGISPTKFGGINALTNGLRLVVIDKNGNELLDFLDGATIQQNADWVLLAGIDNPVTAAAGDDEFAVRWTLERGLGAPGLELEPEQRFRIIVQDNLTELTAFRMFAQGTR